MNELELVDRLTEKAGAVGEEALRQVVRLAVVKMWVGASMLATSAAATAAAMWWCFRDRGGGDRIDFDSPAVFGSVICAAVVSMLFVALGLVLVLDGIGEYMAPLIAVLKR